LELLLNTAQRRGDVVRMGPQHIRDDPEHGPVLHVRQQKTDVSLHLPIFLELQEAINAMPSKGRHLTFLVTVSGKPFSPLASPIGSATPATKLACMVLARTVCVRRA
jgi:hypothetical protein